MAGLAGCAVPQPRRALGEIDTRPLQGVSARSESVQCSAASADGSVRVSTRLCRYPDFGVAWIWFQADTPAGFFSFIRHDVPCTSQVTEETEVGATFSDSIGLMRFARNGTGDQLEAVQVGVQLSGWRTNDGRHGAGPEAISALLEFVPRLGHANLLPDRQEKFGDVGIELVVGGMRFTARGLGQYHEQRQSVPRFVTPFSYASLWAPDAASTLLLTPEGEGGYLIDPDGVRLVERVAITPPAGRRTLTLTGQDYPPISGTARIVCSYSIEIYGELWQGAFVDAVIAERSYLGFINDWRREVLPYR
jgi:hypothetical protein